MLEGGISYMWEMMKSLSRENETARGLNSGCAFDTHHVMLAVERIELPGNAPVLDGEHCLARRVEYLRQAHNNPFSFTPP